MPYHHDKKEKKEIRQSHQKSPGVARLEKEPWISELESLGWQARIVSIRRLQELEQEIESRRLEGQINEEFDRERLSQLAFSPHKELADAQSIIVIAIPRPQTKAIFTRKNHALPLILPPTYTAYKTFEETAAGRVEKLLAPQGYRVARAKLPLKLTAAHSGLAAYGKNNICYVRGMGSFLQLAAVFSDLPCPEDHWQEARMMDQCRKCTACLKACPTGAIPTDRFLLRAELCLTFHNERPGHIRFPNWIDPTWHNCLEGCMHCQRVCPEDKRLVHWVEETEEFSGEETASLLKEASLSSLTAETIAKLERLGIVEDLGIIPRNLEVFIERMR